MTKLLNPVPEAGVTEFVAGFFNAATITLAAALGLLTVVTTF
ncbi:MAG TPA: hypothetical protein VFS01_13510 [Rhizomicrobium sp.]|jgi:hypothetical protein|nr:hypothetical protein [Rhizomicrobium sp.]HVV72668.1 hypothetical protein [Verrucomicrobiae bacterium]